MVLKNNISKRDNRIGQIFTPSYIAKFMVDNISNFLGNSEKKPQNLRILEPSVGEGIFLKYLLKYNFVDITAYEMDNNFMKYLLNSYPNIKFKFENFLGSDPNEKFDLIIGNPPYLGQNYNARIFQEYVKKFPFCSNYFVGNMDLFYFFIHLGIEKLNPGGFLSFITTNYWITKSRKTGIKLIKPHVLEECLLLQYIDLSHLKPFEGAKGQHNCIFVLQKKTEYEKKQKINKNIEIIQLFKNRDSDLKTQLFNERIFNELIFGKDSNNIKKFTSALTNNDLKKDESWNLIYPIEVRKLVAKIEEYCMINGKISLLKDYFLIRNGLILIKDAIFILNEGENLIIKDDDFFIRVNGEFLKLKELEKTRLKKIYKSRSIKPYSYDKENYEGYAIYFNKNEFNSDSFNERNILLNKKYPILSKYIQQYEEQLREILINAKENPEDFYYPRRGSFIRQFDVKDKENLTDLEILYDNAEKIFFKFISKKNIFGYSDNPYYATSDTYFLWPKYSDVKIDYFFILAYLNSNLVYFIYKAKNLFVKRSKTILEQGLPIPHPSNFENKEKKAIIKLIKTFSTYLIKNYGKNFTENTKNLIDKMLSSDYYKSNRKPWLKETILRALKNHDRNLIQNAIDQLFFQLFNLDENLVNKLLNEYYNLQLN